MSSYIGDDNWCQAKVLLFLMTFVIWMCHWLDCEFGQKIENRKSQKNWPRLTKSFKMCATENDRRFYCNRFSPSSSSTSSSYKRHCNGRKKIWNFETIHFRCHSLTHSLTLLLPTQRAPKSLLTQPHSLMNQFYPPHTHTCDILGSRH